MSFQATAAHSSRITKPRRKSAVAALGLKRTTSSPSAASSKRRSLPNDTTTPFDDDEELDDTGVIASLADDLNFRDVPQYMEYIRNRTFSDMPEKAGMNSTRIAEVLNFRRRLPPFVTVAHIDALSTSSTRIEREIAELARAGVLRRVTIPNRGIGAAAVGDGIASVREWQALVQSHAELPEDLKAKYITAMNANPVSTSIPGTTFTSPELSALVTFGFLTSASSYPSNTSLFASPGASSLLAVSASGSRHAAGSLNAVGGTQATQHIHGGTSLSGSRPSVAARYNLSLPNMGAHIKLLVDARNHLLTLLRKTKHREMPFDVLRERWDGNVAAHDIKAERKKLRGEFAGVLPGRTKKWKTFYGMRFEWVLEECLGAGLVELFETGSVGRAVRAMS
ncbi:serine-threonine protein kinase 19-domain-containing protein [Alternaria rosae]|uniref:serine-threonine protein kinase 19-domain-containing protein n=1 Tax=Alternaria rosae TaxID=1187941 RepID=UPI001E8D0D77|nr:serine-threonine protein kinase 19-domain-containing protein [Alternaria rosae]KAH6866966.1 serine-threonine protein kinase 19-domain-containing protein [Alternaria rosae]